MKGFYYREYDTIITIEELKATFEELKKEQPTEYNYSFNQYIINCTSKNGFLEEIGEI